MSKFIKCPSCGQDSFWNHAHVCTVDIKDSVEMTDDELRILNPVKIKDLHFACKMKISKLISIIQQQHDALKFYEPTHKYYAKLEQDFCEVENDLGKTARLQMLQTEEKLFKLGIKLI